jgi:hypothetical protein
VWLEILEPPGLLRTGQRQASRSHLMHDKHPARTSTMPSLSEWAGGRVSGRVGKWPTMCRVWMGVSMYVRACVCMHMCVNTPAASNRHTLGAGQRNGRMEARWDGWMDGLCGEGGTPFEIQPCGPIERFGGFQKLVGYQTEGMRGHVCVPCK